MQRDNRPGPTSLGFSIVGDELEQHRIQLENNLQETDLSLHLSSVPGDSVGPQDNPSIEYPRHRSGPSPADFSSFVFSVRGETDLDSFGNPHAWSHRTFDDDDEGIHPYAGETISTAAHHASALTLSAGLTGRAAANVSEVEYDPERPLQRMIAPADRSKDGVRSRSPRVNGKTKLDRVLQSGHTFPQPTSSSLCIKSPRSSSNTSELDISAEFRPKFSDALRRVSFSPKRPRNSPSRHSRQRSHSHLLEQPTTPHRPAHPSPLSPLRPTYAKADANVTKPRVKRGIRVGNDRVQLPDVTGVTSAIESPAKGALLHNQYQINNEFREEDACLISTLNAVQSKLSHLEAENGISRRRVRELEVELLTWKREAEKDHSRKPKNGRNESKTSNHSIRRDVKATGDGDDESQALEDLIATLRAHLARLTRELSSHHQMLNELQSHRESDSHTLQSKFREVDILGQEVEQLAGEVGVLRGMVEEGWRTGQQVRGHGLCPQEPSDDDSVQHFSEKDVACADREPRETKTDPTEEGTSEPRSSNARQPVRSITPFPQIRGTRLERLFFSVPEHGRSSSPQEVGLGTKEEDEGFVEGDVDGSQDPKGADTKGKQPEGVPRMPPRKVLAKVVRELEDDFAHYKSIYIELSEEYKYMDAVSDPPRRNILARHLRDVIGMLEQRGDQIASLHNVLKRRNPTDSKKASDTIPT